jgi:LysM repeat protein
MTDTIENEARRRDARRAEKDHRVARGILNTLPFVLVGSMTVGLGLTGPIEPVQPKPKPEKAKSDSLAKAVKTAFAGAAASTGSSPDDLGTAGSLSTAAAPTTYTVKGGDSVSSIAGRYGLATASVLALNGLGWKSVIFPGQVLKLTNGATPVTAAPAPAAPAAGKYTIQKGDTLGKIAARFGLPTQTLLSANGLGWSSIIYPGQSITIPGSSAPTAASAVVIVADPAPVATTPVPAAPRAAQTSYTIQSGDTVSRIAAKFGVTAQAILEANGLSWSSIIYGGRSLTIPGGAITSTASVTPTATSTAIPGMTAEMAANARTIVAVGRSLGVPEYGLVIALAAAMQESGLRNLNYGDRDSLGLFQQRPSSGWGTPAQIRDTTHSARLFFGGVHNPNKGKTRGLLDISGWQSKTVTQAAQAVQRSGYPEAYAKWEPAARAWLKQL